MAEDVVIKFILGDKLPTYYDAAMAIFSVCRKLNSKKMDSTIKNYADSLIDMWQKSFGNKFVMSRNAVISRIEKLAHHYFNNVVSNVNRTKDKHGAILKPQSERALNKQWKNSSISVRLKGDFSIDGLMDIGIGTEALEGSEKVFYHDQKNARICRLSVAIDDEWVEEQLKLIEIETQKKEQGEQQADFENDNDDCGDEHGNDGEDAADADMSINRSGLVRVVTVDANTQTDALDQVIQPDVRKLRDCLMAVKTAIVILCVNCNLSAKMAILAFQIVCEHFYNHKYYLTKDEAIANDPDLQTIRDEEVEAPQSKKPRFCNKQQKKTPKSKDDYLPYKKVLPHPRTINNHKQMLAIQAESDAANALYNMVDNIRCTLHYDTTSRCRIDGEWPAIIFSFSDKQRYVLRPLFFAYEDREQIVRLLVETFERLALLVTTASEGMDSTPKVLWEKLNIIMTDSVEKNLHIEEGIATALGSSHHPYHFLCKSHTVEALDRSNVDVLAKLETALKFREALLSQNPNVKSFLRGEKSVVLCAIKSILSFVSHDKSASSTNQADLFDYVLQREDKVKHLSLYQERRFTKLGYSCASILDALPYIQMVLNETHLSNQHTEIVQLFVDSELLLTELNCLAYFTTKVSLPLLYAVEICNQDELCEILPNLHKDLLNCNLETLHDYYIEYRHVKVNAPSSEIEKEIIKSMCIDAAKTIECQCGSEYGFGKSNDELNLQPRAIEIYKLPQSLRNKLDNTNNIVAECHLSVFDKKSEVSKCRNYKFKAKSIRNDLVLHNSSFKNNPTAFLKKIAAIVNEREEKWTKEQKLLHQQKIEEKMEKARNQSQYVHKLLVMCKGWGGPTQSTDELDSILRANPQLVEKIVKIELTYYRHTHRSDVIATPSLFKLNKVNHTERLTNLYILLNGQSTSVTALPRNNDALQVLRNIDNGESASQDENKNILDVGQMCATLWNENGHATWYLGYCIDVLDNGLYTVEHIHRVVKDSNLKWKYPTRDDTAEVYDEQILDCEIDGEWNITNRKTEFTLKNHNIINAKVNDVKHV